MVDPKQTNERTVETQAGLQAARKVWVTPRLETSSISEDTESGNNAPPDGAALSVS